MVSRAWVWGVAVCALATAAAAGEEPAGPDSPPPSVPAPGLACRHLSLECLTRMSWPELECLYRESEPGAIPAGYTPGRAIYCPDSRLAGVRSRMTGALWHGKIFDPCDGTLVNQWLGLRAIKARVCYGPSWLDGRPSIIMDYSETSWVWAEVRDELREVAPGLYLGRMYRRKACGPQFQIFFALEACPPVCTGP
jgi:hypothetical protein